MTVVERDIELGWAEYSSGKYEAATQAFERVLNAAEASGDSLLLADAYDGLGWIYLSFSRTVSMNQNYIAKSLEKFQEAIDLNKNNADAWVGRAVALLVGRDSQDDLQDALKAIDNALQGDADCLYRHDYNSSADLYALKAQCYYYMGEFDNARKEIARVLAVKADNSIALAMKDLLY